MSDVYRIWGAEMSPYSVKVRSYYRYKGIPHEWIARTNDTQAESQKYAKLPLVPIVATPEDEGLQDSTPIIEKMEAKHPEPAIHPEDPALAFVSALLEEFGDEWGNKWMFHYRWARDVDQISGSERLVKGMMPALEGEQLAQMAGGIRTRMVGRVGFVGSSPQTAPIIEDSFKEAMGQLEPHLAVRPYLFGGRPAFADFGLWGQIYNAWTDPTCNEILESKSPNVIAWVRRMLEPKVEGEFEAWDAITPGLTPLVERQVARLFLPWSAANAKALAAGEEEFSVDLEPGTWTQKTQKYHARSLAALRARYATVAGDKKLDAFLEATGCLRWLRAA